MIRLIALAGLILLIIAIALGLKACNDGKLSLHGRQTAQHGDMSSIVALNDGAVMTAPRGTVGRDIIDWLDTPNPGERNFELGGQEFIGRSVEPTPESIDRANRFVEILRSHPDVTVKVLGYSDASGDPADDFNISTARAKWLVTLLEAAHIDETRLSYEGRGSADPVGDNRTPTGRALNERVAVDLVSHR